MLCNSSASGYLGGVLLDIGSPETGFAIKSLYGKVPLSEQLEWDPTVQNYSKQWLLSSSAVLTEVAASSNMDPVFSTLTQQLSFRGSFSSFTVHLVESSARVIRRASWIFTAGDMGGYSQLCPDRTVFSSSLGWSDASVRSAGGYRTAFPTGYSKEHALFAADFANY